MSASNLSFDSAVASLQPKARALMPFTNYYLRNHCTLPVVDPPKAKFRTSSLINQQIESKPEFENSPQKLARHRPPAIKPQRRIEVNTPDLRFLIGMEDTEETQSEVKTDRPATPAESSTTIRSEPQSAVLPSVSHPSKRAALPINNIHLLVPTKPRLTLAVPLPDRTSTARGSVRDRRAHYKSLTSKRSILVQGAKCQYSQKGYILESEVREIMCRPSDRHHNAAILRAKLRDYFQSGASRKLPPAGLKRTNVATSYSGFPLDEC